jgi:hypothetical protein
MPVFQAGDAGANPVEAAISYRKRRLLIRNRSSFPPHRIFSGACRQPEPAGANFCARGVGATRRSASPQSRVRFPARAPWSCGVNSQHSGLLIRRVRVQLPPAPPFCHQSVIEGGLRRSLPQPSDLELLAVAFARWESSHPAVRKTVLRRCKSGTRVQFQRGCDDNSSMPRPQRG